MEIRRHYPGSWLPNLKNLMDAKCDVGSNIHRMTLFTLNQHTIVVFFYREKIKKKTPYLMFIKRRFSTIELKLLYSREYI